MVLRTRAQKREWIVQEWFRAGYDKIIMLDDDLRFAPRSGENDWHLKDILAEELIAEFERIEQKPGPAFPHVGFGQRQGNHLFAGLEIVRENVLRARILPADCNHKNQIWPCCRPRGYVRVTTIVVEMISKRDLDGNRLLISAVTICPAAVVVRNVPVAISNAEAKKLAKLFPGYISVVKRNYSASVPRLYASGEGRLAVLMTGGKS